MEKVEGSIVDETFGCWREEDKGVRYVDKLRKGWKKNAERGSRIENGEFIPDEDLKESPRLTLCRIALLRSR
ncbi:MAG: hypothetical protein ACTSSA_14195, partial [Candidatus Freyarchaeota archaeon]